MRTFGREKTNVICGLVINNKVFKVNMVNFSRMGALIATTLPLENEQCVSLMYQNEKNEMIKMLTYVVRNVRYKNQFYTGLQFVELQR
jgi:hypothetical protein